VHRRNGRLLLTITTVGAALATVSCGAGSDRTALAIEATRWAADGTLVVTTECARDLEVAVGADHGGSDLAEVTVWGRPEAGRCEPEVTVALPDDPGGGRPTKIVDGTTSMVVDLPSHRR
jgi:hypothetical protein